jgi:hypothetical protein
VPGTGEGVVVAGDEEGPAVEVPGDVGPVDMNEPPPDVVPAPQPAKIVTAAKNAPGKKKTRFTLDRHLSRRRPDNKTYATRQGMC